MLDMLKDILYSSSKSDGDKIFVLQWQDTEIKKEGYVTGRAKQLYSYSTSKSLWYT